MIYPDEEIVVTAAVNLSTKLDEIPVFDFVYKFLKKPEPEKTDSTHTNQNNTPDKS